MDQHDRYVVRLRHRAAMLTCCAHDFLHQPIHVAGSVSANDPGKPLLAELHACAQEIGLQVAGA